MNEAMAVRRVLVVSDAVGCTAALAIADMGWLYPAGDIDALLPQQSQQFSRSSSSADSGQRRSDVRRSTVSPPSAALRRQLSQC